MNSSLIIPVCLLCQAFSHSVHDLGVNEYFFSECSATACLKSGKFDLITSNLRQSFDKVYVNRDTNNLELHNIDSSKWANILVHSILGKSTLQLQGDDKAPLFFQYDVYKQTLLAHYPLCVFEKQIYSILLILTVLIILAALTTAVINQRKLELNYASVPTEEPDMMNAQNTVLQQPKTLQLWNRKSRV